MSQTYFAILTAVGEAKLANAAALGATVQITQMAMGDGNGDTPIPVRTQTALVREKRRAPLNALSIDPVNASQIIAEQVIPESVGGWWIRELGLYDAAGDLVAVANCAPTYKPQLAEGSGRTQVIRMVLIVSATTAVELKIDPSVVLATRAYVDSQDALHVAAADPHPQYATDVDLNAHKAAADPHAQYAPKASPTFTGVAAAPTPGAGDNSSKIATTAFVKAALDALINASPAALDTLQELAAALGNDANFAATVTNALALKAPLASPVLTGDPKAPTPARFDNDTSLATTAFVQQALGSYSGYSGMAASKSLTAADIGTAIFMASGGWTLTLPTPNSLGIPIGSAFTVFGTVGTASSVVPGAGATINTDASSASVSVQSGQSATFVAITGTTWQVVASNATLGANAAFGASLGPGGYQKLPSGLIIQWGSISLTMNTANTLYTTPTTFPIAFPNACLDVHTTPSNCPTAYVNTSSESFGKTGFSLVSAIGAGSASSFSARYLAFGY